MHFVSYNLLLDEHYRIFYNSHAGKQEIALWLSWLYDAQYSITILCVCQFVCHSDHLSQKDWTDPVELFFFWGGAAEATLIPSYIGL